MKQNWKAAACSTFLAGALALIGGCDKQNQGGGTASASAAPSGDAGQHVAVVDLDKVARDLGWAAKLDTSLGAYQAQLRNDLMRYALAYRQKFEEERAKILPKPTEQPTQQQQEQLTQMIVQAQQQVGQLEQQANQQFNQFKNDSLRRMREALAPIVRQVAQDKKVVMVFSPLDPLIYSDPSVDLTNAVFDAARKQPPTLTDVNMTPLKGPTIVQGGATQPSTGGTTLPSSSTTQP